MRLIGLVGLFAGTFLGVSLAQTSQDPLKDGPEFKTTHIAETIQHFQDVLNADPTNIPAHLGMGRAFKLEYIAGVDSPENRQYAERARADFQKVLSLDAHNKPALLMLALLAIKEKKLDQAREWIKQVLTFDPNDKAANYLLGAVTWTEWLPVDRQAHIDSGQHPGAHAPISNASIRQDLRAKWLPILDDGIKGEEAALTTDATYRLAMAYTGRLIRNRADLLDSPEEYTSEMQRGDMWDKRSREPISPGANHSVTAVPGDARPIWIGPAMAQAKLIFQVPPVYPASAKEAGNSGIVRFKVRINKEGHVYGLDQISGDAVLGKAADDAVRQFVYKPMLLNGNPVEVVTTVDVSFTLQP